MPSSQCAARAAKDRGRCWSWEPLVRTWRGSDAHPPGKPSREAESAPAAPCEGGKSWGAQADGGSAPEVLRRGARGTACQRPAAGPRRPNDTQFLGDSGAFKPQRWFIFSKECGIVRQSYGNIAVVYPHVSKQYISNLNDVCHTKSRINYEKYMT